MGCTLSVSAAVVKCYVNGAAKLEVKVPIDLRTTTAARSRLNCSRPTIQTPTVFHTHSRSKGTVNPWPPFRTGEEHPRAKASRWYDTTASSCWAYVVCVLAVGLRDTTPSACLVSLCRSGPVILYESDSPEVLIRQRGVHFIHPSEPAIPVGHARLKCRPNGFLVRRRPHSHWAVDGGGTCSTIGKTRGICLTMGSTRSSPRRGDVFDNRQDPELAPPRRQLHGHWVVDDRDTSLCPRDRLASATDHCDVLSPPSSCVDDKSAGVFCKGMRKWGCGSITGQHYGQWRDIGSELANADSLSQWRATCRRRSK